MRTVQQLQTFVDERGILTVTEHIPFEVKRVFWIYGVPEMKERAGHSHDLCQQVLICVNGSVEVHLGQTVMDREVYWLDRADLMLHIKAGLFITLKNFSRDAVLLVLASERYDPTDNIQ